MCVPVPVLAVLSGVVSGMGAMAQANAQAQAASAQAQAYERQAVAERLTAEFNADRQVDKNMSLLSQQRAGYLAAGLSLEGSPTDVIADTATETQIDVQAIKFNGEIKAQNFEMQRDIYNIKAAGYRQAGIFGAISPVIRGFSGSFGGGSLGGGGSTSVDDV